MPEEKCEPIIGVKEIIPKTIEDLLKQIKSLLSNQEKYFISIQNLLKTSEELLKISIDTQKIHYTSLEGYLDRIAENLAPKREKYFNTEITAISVATPIKPEHFDIVAPNGPGGTGYDRVRIFEEVNRISPHVSVINDGTTALYILVSPDGQSWTTQEAPILVGEARLFFNVYELRIRSPEAGNTTTLTGGLYRVTEYDYALAYATIRTPNRTLFTTSNVAVPGPPPAAGALLPPLTIPDGFALVVRANVNNAGQVFVANSIINTAIAVNRNTLATGDSVSLYVTNANLVAVLGNIAGQTVDLIVEQ